MSAGSPTAHMMWGILSVFFMGFLGAHLWGYDRLACLRWNSGRQSGSQPRTFRRVMTYCYVFTTPLLSIYSVGLTTCQAKEGYVVIGTDVYPKPATLWTGTSSRWILPLNVILSVAWTLEFITHLEELTFWLFLLNQGPHPREWFQSWEFSVWKYGSALAIAALPSTAIITRSNVLTSDAYIYIIGAGGAFATTICFLDVLRKFPTFLRSIKAGGVDNAAYGRLRTFYHLNLVRVGFRFLFTIPLLVVAIDSIHNANILSAYARLAPAMPLSLPDQRRQDDPVGQFRHLYPVISHPFLTDTLLLLAGVGCFVSSGITLLIFFPWSSAPAAGGSGATRPSQQGASWDESKPPIPPSPSSSFDATSSVHALSLHSAPELEMMDQWSSHPDNVVPTDAAPEPHTSPSLSVSAPSAFTGASGTPLLAPPLPAPVLNPVSPAWRALHGRHSLDAPRAMPGSQPMLRLPRGPSSPDAFFAGRTEQAMHSAEVRVHPYVATFTSPIDLYDHAAEEWPGRTS